MSIHSQGLCSQHVSGSQWPPVLSSSNIQVPALVHWHSPSPLCVDGPTYVLQFHCLCPFFLLLLYVPVSLCSACWSVRCERKKRGWRGKSTATPHSYRSWYMKISWCMSKHGVQKRRTRRLLKPKSHRCASLTSSRGDTQMEPWTQRESWRMSAVGSYW